MGKLMGSHLFLRSPQMMLSGNRYRNGKEGLYLLLRDAHGNTFCSGSTLGWLHAIPLKE